MRKERKWKGGGKKGGGPNPKQDMSSEGNYGGVVSWRKRAQKGREDRIQGRIGEGGGGKWLEDALRNQCRAMEAMGKRGRDTRRKNERKESGIVMQGQLKYSFGEEKILRP